MDNAQTVEQLADNEKEIRLCFENIVKCIDGMNIEAAREYLERARTLAPEAAVMSFYKGIIEFSDGNIELAMKAYEDAINGGYVTESSTFHLGNIYQYLGRHNAAVEMLSRAEALAPNKSRAVEAKAAIYYSEKDYRKCLINAQKLMKEFPDISSGYHFNFLVNLRYNNIERATEIINYCLDKFPDDINIKYDLINYYSTIGNYEEALRCLEIYSDNDSEFAGNLYVKQMKIKILYNMREYAWVDKLGTELFKTLYLDDIALIMIISLIHLENYHKALQCIKLIKDNIGDSDYEIWYLSAIYYEGYIYKILDNTDKSKEIFKDALEKYMEKCIKYPMIFDLYLYRTLSLISLENYDEALKCAEYMETVFVGDNHTVYYVISEIYNKMNNVDKREEYFEMYNEKNRKISPKILIA